MDFFDYRGDALYAEDVPVADLSAEFGTPLYIYSKATLLRHLHAYTDALTGHPHLVCFGMKANSNLSVLQLLAEAGAGFDIVSVGELERVLRAGGDPAKVVFSGVGKTPAEMQRALEVGIHCFNVESIAELHLLQQVADGLGVIAPVSLRINPDVDAKTHEKIATGKSENKFGIPIAKAPAVYALAASLPGIEVIGIDVHIGSQLTDLEPFRQAYEKVRDLTLLLRAQGHDIRRLDLGGGLGIPYERNNTAPPLPTEYGALISDVVGDLGVEVEIEPGRLISGNAGLLVSSVVYVKEGEGRDFLILDAAMNDLVRPAMYGAWHDIVPVTEPAPGLDQRPFDVVGPVCETGDTFAKQRQMTPVAAGDLVAFRSAGAYGAVMASEYNTRPLIPEVMVKADQFAVIRARPTFDEIINRDTVPSWV